MATSLSILKLRELKLFKIRWTKCSLSTRQHTLNPKGYEDILQQPMCQHITDLSFLFVSLLSCVFLVISLVILGYFIHFYKICMYVFMSAYCVFLHLWVYLHFEIFFFLPLWVYEGGMLSHTFRLETLEYKGKTDKYCTGKFVFFHCLQ